MLNLIIFISGRGSNLENIINAINKKKLNAKIQYVVSNNEEAYGLTIAKNHNIPAITLPKVKLSKNLNDPQRVEYDKKIHELIKNTKS